MVRYRGAKSMSFLSTWPFSTNLLSQMPHNAQIIFFIYRLIFWQEFRVHNTAIIRENSQWLRSAEKTA